MGMAVPREVYTANFTMDSDGVTASNSEWTIAREIGPEPEELIVHDFLAKALDKCSLIPRTEYNNFIKWAFPGYNPNQSPERMIKQWNENHIDLFQISGQSEVNETTVKMVYAYLNRHKKKIDYSFIKKGAKTNG